MKTAFLLLLLSPLSFGWGPEGHHTVARLAQARLNAKASAAVKDLLGGPMVDVSTWADEIRTQRRESGPWHYINIPIEGPRTRSADFCPQRRIPDGH